MVGVIIRSPEWCDLVKIKPTELEAEHRIPLWLCHLWSSENDIVRVGSRSGRANQSQHSFPGLVIGWFFNFCFRFWQFSFHWIMHDGVINGIRINENVLILPTLILSTLWLCSRLVFTIGRSTLMTPTTTVDSRPVISTRQPAIIAGYFDKNHRLLHSRNDTESIDTEQVWPADSYPW